MTDIITGIDPSTGFGDWIFVPAKTALWVDDAGVPVVDQSGIAINAVVDQSTTQEFLGDLATSVLISLFSDAAADTEDKIPDGTDNRRGWWGGAIGSKLWLLQRSKAQPSVADDARAYAADALAWLVTDGIAATVDVSAQWLSGNALALTIIITRATGSPIALKFSNLWDFF
jgi:phage gp46-like protein